MFSVLDLGIALSFALPRFSKEPTPYTINIWHVQKIFATIYNLRAYPGNRAHQFRFSFFVLLTAFQCLSQVGLREKTRNPTPKLAKNEMASATARKTTSFAY
jgi:hypothetical protein